MTVFPPDDIKILYKNHRGETSWRRVRPSHIWYGRTEYHPLPRWLLSGYDLDKEAGRDFAMNEIVTWKDATSPHDQDEQRAFSAWLLEYQAEFGEDIYKILLETSEKGKFDRCSVDRDEFLGVAKTFQSFLVSIDRMVHKS